MTLCITFVGDEGQIFVISGPFQIDWNILVIKLTSFSKLSSAYTLGKQNKSLKQHY
eukprot:c26668_g1_i1 orf=118-285(+)